MALNNHFNYFNSTTVMSSMILGATLAVEEKDGIAAKDTVQSLKTSLMGPFAGVGDTLVWVLWPTIIGSISGYMAQQGNPLRDYLAFVQYRILVCKIKDVPDRIYVRNKVDHKFRKTSDSIYRGGIYHGLKRSRSADCYFCKNNDSFEF